MNDAPSTSTTPPSLIVTVTACDGSLTAKLPHRSVVVGLVGRRAVQRHVRAVDALVVHGRVTLRRRLRRVDREIALLEPDLGRRARIEAPIRAVGRILRIASMDDEVHRLRVVGEPHPREPPVLVLAEERLRARPVGRLRRVDRVAPQVQSPEVVGIAGGVVAVVAGGALVVDQRVRRLRTARLRELDPDVHDLVGGQVARQVVHDRPERQRRVLGDVARVEEHPVRGVVVRADRHVVAVALADGERDLGQDVLVERGRDLDPVPDGMPVHHGGLEHRGVAVLEARDVDRRRRVTRGDRASGPDRSRTRGPAHGAAACRRRRS